MNKDNLELSSDSVRSLEQPSHSVTAAMSSTTNWNTTWNNNNVTHDFILYDCSRADVSSRLNTFYPCIWICAIAYESVGVLMLQSRNTERQVDKYTETEENWAGKMKNG